MCFRQTVLATEVQAAVRALPHDLDRSIAARVVGAYAVLAAFLDTAPKSKDKVQRRFLLNVVITQSAPVFELLSGKDKTLLVGRDALLVLNLGFD